MRTAAFRLVPPRRGVVVTLAVAAAAAVGLAGRWRQWLGVWNETQSYLGLALILLLPAAVGAAAWIGTGNRRDGLDSMAVLASRRRWRIVVRELVETWVWSSAGFVLVAVPAVVLTARSASYGGVNPTALLVDLTLVSTATAIGLGAGRRIPWLLAAPVTAVVTYAALAFFSLSASDVTAALTSLDGRAMTFHTVPMWVHGAQAALWILVTSAITLRRVGRPWSAVAAGWLAGVVAAPLLYVGDGDRRPDDEAVAVGCGDATGGIVVCMPRAKAYLEPRATAFLTETRGLLRGLVPERAAYIDGEASGLSRAATTSIQTVAQRQRSDGRTVVLFQDLQVDLSAYTQIDRDSFLVDVAAATFPHSRTGPRQPKERKTQAVPSDALQRWLLESLDVPIDGSAQVGGPRLDGSLFSFARAAEPLRWLRALDDVERARWFAAHRDDIRRGLLTFGDFR